MLNLSQKLQSLFDQKNKHRARKRRQAIAAESLEERALLSSITVTSADDVTAADGNVTLREAIAAANADVSVDGSTAGNGFDTIVFDPALIGETITLQEGELLITSGLQIEGLGADDITIDGNFASRIFQVNPGTQLTLEGMTLINGLDAGTDSDTLTSTPATSGVGGAILNYGTLNIVDSVLSNHSAEGGDSTQLTSSAGGGAFGGAIASFEGSVTIADSTISSSTATSGNSSFTANGANALGGAIYARRGSLFVRGTTIDGNSVAIGSVDTGTPGIAAGGGISVVSTSVFVQSSTISGNQAGLGGGVFRSVTAGASTTLDIINTTVSGNMADIGGGVYHGDTGTTSIDFSTLSENDGSTQAGGIYNLGVIQIGTSIMTGNTAGADPNATDASTTLNSFQSTGDNIFGDMTGVITIAGETSNELNVSAASVILPLADYGGPTQTHMLVPGSQAINAVTQTSAITLDQRGEQRPSDGTADIGAVELSADDVTDIAADLDLSLGLVTTGNLFENWAGAGEKWMKGTGGEWYFILPNGEFYQWDGNPSATGTLLTTLPTAYHGAPDLLYHAYTMQLDRELGLQTTGNYHENWGGAGEKWLKDRDGQWYFILPNGQLFEWDGSAGANGDFLYAAGSEFHANPELLVNAHSIGMDRQFSFEAGSGAFDAFGAQEKWFDDITDQAYFVLPGGGVYKWDGSAAATGMLITSQGSDVYDDPSLLYNAFDQVMDEWTGLV